MRNNNQPLSLGFFWMWLFLALSAGFCLLSRFSYSKLKFAQGKQVRIFQEKIRNTYYDIANKESDEEIGVDFLDSNKVDVIDPSSSNTKIWSELSCCSSRIGIVFFVLGIVVFIYIGAELVF
ncbi:hypothetical protein H6768_06025 [Candidatus Peribacteria bacterium]|nr:hypothetical protein [Candidatus Peribacteria bacterium]